MRVCISASFAALTLAAGPTLTRAAEPPKLLDLRTQTAGGATYFHARFDRPADFWQPPADRFSEELNRRALIQLPRLVPQDGPARDVALRVEPNPAARAGVQRMTPVPAGGLEFVGRLGGGGPGKFLLLYARADRDHGPTAFTPVEVPITIDFGQASAVPPPQESRRADRAPAGDDLEGLWAAAQVVRLAALEAQAPEFGFYGFARAAVARKYNVPSQALALPGLRDGSQEMRRAYETTTGAAAITESLQLQRLLGGASRDDGPREVDVAKVPGIDIAEHPWERMMAGQTPDPEPLAALVPHDNYYVHFKSFAKYIEMSDFLTEWGGAATRLLDVRGRDDQLRERYEKQLCLRTTLLGRTFGPLVIRGVAITGNDGYLREGSDLAMIFHLADAKLFRNSVEPFLQAARAEFGDRLKEAKEDYHGVTIDSFVTPRREVSLYRAAFDDIMVYANSPVGMRRLLDARAGRIKRLADSLDFRYMRTAFRHGDTAEDGFMFLSDAFIRQLVGPASKIKEKRRLEALTGLTMTTNAALYHAWETGKPPADLDTMLRVSGVKISEMTTTDQPTVSWDADRQLAWSGGYNTLHFATPLVELPIDRVTRREERDYSQFRAQYLGLWRQYFDPVGMRVRLDGKQVKVETYILPLIQSSQYNELRRLTGGAGVPLGVAPPTGRTVMQIHGHLAPDARERDLLSNTVSNLGAGKAPWLGDWWLLRFDDSPVYGQLAELALRDDVFPDRADEWINTFFRMPATFGVEVRNPLIFAGVLTALRESLMKALPGAVTWEPMEPEYKGTKIVRIQATRQGLAFVRPDRPGAKEPFLPAVYYALVDGAWYASLQEQPIRDLIDRSVAARERPAAGSEGPKVNSAFYAAPAVAEQALPYVRGRLERESRQRALANAAVWYAFERSGLLAGKDEAGRLAVARHYLGAAPVSPEGAPYRYDPRTDEVVNARHGSPRQPTPQKMVDPNSPLGRVLEQLKTLRADLRFREDGVHTTVTVEKK